MSRRPRVGSSSWWGCWVLTYFTFRVSKWGLIAEKGYLLTVDFITPRGWSPSRT